MWVFLTPNIHLVQPSDTRQVNTWAWASDQSIEAAVGQGFSFVGQDHDSFAWRIGIDGGAFMSFAPGQSLTFHFMTLDGTFGVPLDLRLDDWVLRTEWRHDSAHFGDGIRHASNKPPESALDTYSLESLAVLVGYNGRWCQPQVGGRWVYHAVGPAPKAVLQAGAVLEMIEKSYGPYVSVTGKKPVESLSRPSLSAQAGFRVTNDWTLRLALQGYVGGSDAGRLTNTTEKKLGFWMSWSPLLIVR